jgi:hypothetical protein
MCSVQDSWNYSLSSSSSALASFRWAVSKPSVNQLYGAGFLGVEVLYQLHRALDVGKECGDSFALAVERSTFGLFGPYPDPLGACGCSGWRALAPSRVPHCLQKLASAGFSELHFAHWIPNGLPQPTQNLASSGLSRAHFGQRIAVCRPPFSRKTVQTRQVSVYIAKTPIWHH